MKSDFTSSNILPSFKELYKTPDDDRYRVKYFAVKINFKQWCCVRMNSVYV